MILEFTSIHNPTYKKIIAELIQARKTAGFTQQHVAQHLGTTQYHISKVEKSEIRRDITE